MTTNLEVKWPPGIITSSWGRHHVFTTGMCLRNYSSVVDYVYLQIINSKSDPSATLGIRVPRDKDTLNQIGDMFKEMAKNV